MDAEISFSTRIKNWLVFNAPSKLRAILPDELVIREVFKKRTGRELNLENPQTLNEKLQWIKLHVRDPLMTQCADKYAVREFVKRKIGSGILNELYAVYESADQIDFDSLAVPCILKVTNGSGANMLIRDKAELDRARMRKTLKKWMRKKKNHYWPAREWAYKNISPKIVCEKVMDAGNLMECKIFCFHGEPHFIQGLVKVPNNPKKKAVLFDLAWNKLDFCYDNPVADFLAENPAAENTLPKPACLKEMLEIARALSGDFLFVRIDLYDFHGRVIFGELTFYPSGGHMLFSPAHADRELGKLLTLPVNS